MIERCGLEHVRISIKYWLSSYFSRHSAKWEKYGEQDKISILKGFYEEELLAYLEHMRVACVSTEKKWSFTSPDSTSRSSKQTIK